MPEPDAAAFECSERVAMAAIRLIRTLEALSPSPHLTRPQISALAVIIHSGRITARELARIEDVRPPTISVLIAELESRALVSRKTDRDDRRKQWISATAEGRRLFEAGHRRRLTPLAQAIAALPGGERKALLAGAGQLSSLAEALAAQAGGKRGKVE